jgi:phage terminase large subunit-like protein
LALALAAVTQPKTVRRKPPAKPFTLPHFRAWAADLILDTEESWHPEPFQEAFIEDVFAGFAEAWLVVPEGNGKTTLMGGLALYHCEHKPHASVPVAASSREQAEIMYRQAEGFVLRSPRMYESVHSDLQLAKGKRKTQVPRFVCLEGYRRINHFGGGRIQVFAADDRTGDGVIPTLGIIDEMHRHRDLALYRTWAGKLQKRGGQIVGISTAGEPGSDFEETRKKIRSQSVERLQKGSFVRASSPRLVLHEYAVPDGGNVEDMEVVKAANPFSGVTIPSLTEKFGSPTMTMSHWKRLTCNVPTRDERAAIQESEWADATSKTPIPERARIMLGLDVAWKWDTTAAVPLWSGPDFRQFGPAEIVVPPRDGTITEPELIKAAIRRIHKRNPIDTTVMDLSYAADIATWLQEEIKCEVIDHPQSNAQHVIDYDAFMEGLRTGKLKHSGDPGLTSHVLNAVGKTIGSDTRFDRPNQTRQAAQQERRVIDALSAASMVNTVAAIPPVKPKPALFIGAA